jgi:hypothetical protein
MFSVKQSWIAWLLASILVWIWEFLLHYSPQVLELWGTFEFLSAVSNQNFAIWHIFVLIGIPLYFTGYYHFYLMLRWSWEILARIFFFLAILAFLYWGIWIASRWYIGTIVQLRSELNPEVYSVLTEKYLYYFDSLLQTLRRLLVPLSLLWIYLIFKWKTLYPKYMMIFNPLLLILLVFTTQWAPGVWKFLIPIALNIAHFVLFSISLYFVFTLKNGKKL